MLRYVHPKERIERNIAVITCVLTLLILLDCLERVQYMAECCSPGDISPQTTRDVSRKRSNNFELRSWKVSADLVSLVVDVS